MEGVVISLDGVVPVRMVGVSACYFPLHHKCHVTPAILSCDFDARQSRSVRATSHTASKITACDYEVARCDFVARQSRATKSQV